MVLAGYDVQYVSMHLSSMHALCMLSMTALYKADLALLSEERGPQVRIAVESLQLIQIAVTNGLLNAPKLIYASLILAVSRRLS